MISNESSVTGNSASICCFKIRRTWWNDGVSEVVAISGRNRIEWINGKGYHAIRVMRPVRWRFTYKLLLVNVCSFPQIEFKKGPAEKISECNRNKWKITINAYLNWLSLAWTSPRRNLNRQAIHFSDSIFSN